MRSLLLLGVAAVVVLWTNPVRADDSPRVVVVQRGVDYGQAPPVDARVYTSRDDRQITEADYRERWTGSWEGEWAPDGTSYNGTFRGTYRPDTPYAYDDRDRYYKPYGDERAAGEDVYYDQNVYRGQADDYRYSRSYEQSGYDPREMEHLCGHDATVGGAVVGGLIGGVAGNRIAGRGKRTEGTIIGAGVGAVAGSAIGNAADRQRCEAWRANYRGRGNVWYGERRPTMPRGYGYPARGYAYAYPAYYYASAPVVTTVIVESGCGCQQAYETVTTEYETVYTQPSKQLQRTYAAPKKRVISKGKRVYRK